MTVIERINVLAKNYGSIENFCDVVKINVGSLRNAIHRKSEVREGTIEAIVKAIPNLNLRWLLLGEGEMFVSDYDQRDTPTAVEDPATPYVAKINDLLEKRVQVLEREIKRLSPDVAKDLGID